MFINHFNDNRSSRLNWFDWILTITRENIIINLKDYSSISNFVISILIVRFFFSLFSLLNAATEWCWELFILYFILLYFFLCFVSHFLFDKNFLFFSFFDNLKHSQMWIMQVFLYIELSIDIILSSRVYQFSSYYDDFCKFDNFILFCRKFFFIDFESWNKRDETW